MRPPFDTTSDPSNLGSLVLLEGSTVNIAIVFFPPLRILRGLFLLVSPFWIPMKSEFYLSHLKNDSEQIELGSIP